MQFGLRATNASPSLTRLLFFSGIQFIGWIVIGGMKFRVCKVEECGSKSVFALNFWGEMMKPILINNAAA